MRRAPESSRCLPRACSALSSSASRWNIRWALTFAVCLLAASAAAEMPIGWVTFDGVTVSAQPPHLEFLSSSASELVLEVRTPGVLNTAESEGEDEYRKLEFPGYFRTTEVGYPTIPAVRQLIAVPAGCEISVAVSVRDTLRYSGSALYPVPEPVVAYTDEGWEYIDEEFAYDEQAYGRGTLYPGEVARVDSVGMLRGQGVALLTVYPIQHAPALEEVEAYPVVEVTLTFTGGSGGVSEDVGRFASIARNVMPNYEGLDWPVRAQADTGHCQWCTTVAQCESLKTDYLMIVHGPLAPSGWVESLGQHRADWNGFNVAMVTDTTVWTSQGMQCISDEVIKDFIEELYDPDGPGTAEHMSDGHLGYVLLVGDAREDTTDAYIPAHEESSVDPYGDVDEATTDYWYGCLTADWYPDVMVGRVCAASPEELQYEVQKYVAYEVNATSGVQPTWRDTVLLSCVFAVGADSTCYDGDDTKAESVSAAFDTLRTLMAVATDYEVDEVYASTMGGYCYVQRASAEQHNVAAVSDGCHVVELCCHGDMHECHGLRWYHIQYLDNSGKLPFWMSYSCLTGAYDWWNPGMQQHQPWRCLGERLLHQTADTGVIGYFGASELSSSSWNYLGRFAWSGLVRHHYTKPGEFLTYAKLEDFERTGSVMNAVIFNLLGDPALDLMLTDSEGYGNGYDLSVSPPGVSVSPAFPSPGSTMTFTAVIRNESNYTPDQPVSVVFRVCELDGSECEVVCDEGSVQTAGWGADTLVCNWVVPDEDADAVGARLLSVEIDTTDDIFPDDNEAHVPFGIYFEREGFPVSMGCLGGMTPTVAGVVDSLPGLQVVTGLAESGRITVFSADGESLWSFQAGGAQEIRGPVAVGDVDFVDGEDTAEVVLCASDSVYVLRQGGQRVWARGLGRVHPCSGPALVDIADGDGSLEVVVEGESVVTGEHFVRLCNGDGTDYEWSCSETHGGDGDAGTGVPVGPAAGDLNYDGYADVVSCYGQGVWQHAIAYDGRRHDCGELWKVALSHMGCSANPVSPVLADVVSTEPGLEVLCGSGQLCCLEGATGDALWHHDFSGLMAGVSVADLDGDGSLEVLASTYGTSADPEDPAGYLCVLDSSGTTVDSLALAFPAYGQPVVGDFDGDGYPDIVVAGWHTQAVSTEPRDITYVQAFEFDGTLQESDALVRPLLFWGRLTSNPVVSDADQDDQIELWVADGNGNLHCLEYYWHEGAISRWGAYQHDERHTGTYETPVSGKYRAESNVSWWGDYYMSGDVKIDSLSTMLIQPGTTVRVVPNSDDTDSGTDHGLAELITAGCPLRAYGTGRRPTIFMSAADTSTAGQWWGVRVMAQDTAHPDAELSRVCISDACIGVATVGPESFSVDDCTIDDCQMMGIKCTGSAGWSHIELTDNDIRDMPVGVELHGCSALVDANTVGDCSLYAMRIYQDYGSTVSSNILSGVAEPLTSSTGIWLEGAQEDVNIANNDISDVRIGVYCDRSLHGTFEGNTISGYGYASSTRGMYFYESDAFVGRNSLTGKIDIGYYVDGYEGAAWPTLGIADEADPTAASCADTTVPRCNRLVPHGTFVTTYYVKNVLQDTVKAENNWWGQTRVLAGKFYGPVDWSPHLDDDPDGRYDAGGAPPDRLTLALDQNYPNPFNPVTLVRFTVPIRARVRLIVYDLSGRQVRTLIDGLRDPGPQETAWDGTNDQGERVASGVYFCRLEDGRSVSSKKMVLLK